MVMTMMMRVPQSLLVMALLCAAASFSAVEVGGASPLRQLGIREGKALHCRRCGAHTSIHGGLHICAASLDAHENVPLLAQDAEVARFKNGAGQSFDIATFQSAENYQSTQAAPEESNSFYPPYE